MTKKNIGIILLLIFCLLPTHKIGAQASNTGFIPGNIWYSIINSVSTAGSESIKNIEKTIETKTPNFIAKPIVLGASAVEDFRQNIGTVSKNKKEETQSQIKDLNIIKSDSVKTTSNSTKTEENTLLKPFKYAELFFFTLLSFVLNNKIIFYASFFVIVFLILRYIIRLFFF